MRIKIEKGFQFFGFFLQFHLNQSKGYFLSKSSSTPITKIGCPQNILHVALFELIQKQPFIANLQYRNKLQRLEMAIFLKDYICFVTIVKFFEVVPSKDTPDDCL